MLSSGQNHIRNRWGKNLRKSYLEDKSSKRYEKYEIQWNVLKKCIERGYEMMD